MAIAIIYGVKDELTNKFMQPFFLKEDETADKEALRLFSHNVNSIPLWKNNSSDYSLYKLGAFDDITGTLIKGYYDDEHNYREGILKLASGTAVRKE